MLKVMSSSESPMPYIGRYVGVPPTVDSIALVVIIIQFSGY